MHRLRTLIGSQLARTHVACALLLALAGAASAHAQHELDVPESCGTPSELQREIESLRTVRGGAPSSAVIRLSSAGDGYWLEVSLPGGTRSLRDSDCRSLFRAAIVIAALDGEPAARGDEAPVTQAEQAVPSAELSAPRATPAAALEELRPKPLEAHTPNAASAEEEAQPGLPRKRRPSIAARAFAAADLVYGMVPSVAAGLAGGLALTQGAWGSSLKLGYVTPRSHHAEGQGVEVEALTGGISIEVAPVRALRVGLGAGALLLHGRGLSAPTRYKDWAAEPLVHASLSARLYTRMRWSVDWTATAHWAPRPAGLVVRGFGTVYRAESFAFRTGPALAFEIF